MTDAFPKIYVREYPEVEERDYLNKREKAELVLSQKGRCAGCGIKPRYGFEYDHILELWEGGTNDLDNWQAFGSHKDCKCHAKKSAAATKRRAKMKRLRLEKGQQARRKRNGSKLKSNRKLQSAPFPKSAKMKRSFSGKVVPR